MPFNPSNYEGLDRMAHIENYVGSTLGREFRQQPSSVMCLDGDPRAFTGSGGYSANDCHGARVIVPATGTLVDLSVCVVTQSGGIDVGIYSLAAEPRSKLYSTGSIACSSSGWQVVGQPNLSVTQGQSLEFVLSADNGTVTFANRALPNSNQANIPSNNFWPVGNASLKTVWFKASSMPLPTSFADSAISSNTIIPAVMARVV